MILQPVSGEYRRISLTTQTNGYRGCQQSPADIRFHGVRTLLNSKEGRRVGSSIPFPPSSSLRFVLSFIRFFHSLFLVELTRPGYLSFIQGESGVLSAHEPRPSSPKV
jgi:hypothetical protein